MVKLSRRQARKHEVRADGRSDPSRRRGTGRR